MSEFKGTKGKWVLNWDGGENWRNMLQIVNEKGEEVCNFGDSTLYYPTEGVEPNKYDALLISKSPELYEDSIKDLDLFDELLKSLPLGLQHLTNAIKERKKEKEQLIKEATEL